jgi:hypothetical protein
LRHPPSRMKARRVNISFWRPNCVNVDSFRPCYARPAPRGGTEQVSMIG